MQTEDGSAAEAETARGLIAACEQFDVEAYAALYSGRTKIARLLFIANHCGDNDGMQLDALRMAHHLVKMTEDTQLYRDVVKKIDGRLGKEYAEDEAWCQEVEKKAEAKRGKLEDDLNAHKTNLIKESIRMAYNDLGDFYYYHGSLADAYKNYIHARDYCTTAAHAITMCMNAILLSIEMGQFTHVINCVSKAKQTQKILDPVTVSKLRSAAGLAHLEAEKYKLAAREFLEVGPELANSYTKVIAAQDVATYGGFCALASFDRVELKSEVLDNMKFRNFLELIPAIRFKALIQYTHPFVAVDVHMMAVAFKSSVDGIEEEIEALITGNQIQARIDSHNKVLYARHTDRRNVIFQQVLRTGSEFDRDVRAMLIRAKLLKQEHNLKSQRKRRLLD